MNRVEEQLYRRANDLHRKSIPFIAYCHYGGFGGLSGFTESRRKAPAFRHGDIRREINIEIHCISD